MGHLLTHHTCLQSTVGQRPRSGFWLTCCMRARVHSVSILSSSPRRSLMSSKHTCWGVQPGSTHITGSFRFSIALIMVLFAHSCKYTQNSKSHMLLCHCLCYAISGLCHVHTHSSLYTRFSLCKPSRTNAHQKSYVTQDSAKMTTILSSGCMELIAACQQYEYSST